MADLRRTVYTHKWSPIICKSTMDRESLSVKDGRFTNCDTQPTEATLQGAAILSEFIVMIVLSAILNIVSIFFGL